MMVDSLVEVMAVDSLVEVMAAGHLEEQVGEECQEPVATAVDVAEAMVAATTITTNKMPQTEARHQVALEVALLPKIKFIDQNQDTVQN